MAKRKYVAVSPDDRGTDQTRARLRQDPVAEMAANWRKAHTPGRGEMEEAAREIRTVYMAIVGGLMPRAVDLNRVHKGSSGEFPAWLTAAKMDRYKPWAAECGAHVLPVVIDWLIDEIPLHRIDANRRQRKGTARQVIEGALWTYAVKAGWIGRVQQMR